MVVEPPIGLVVPSLPPFATAVAGSAGLYFYANDTYYRPRPDLGGYEVVNDPVDSTPTGSNPAASAALASSSMPGMPALAAPPGAAASMLAAPAAMTAMTAAAPGAPMATAPTGFGFASPGAASVAAPATALAAPVAAAQMPTRPQMVSLFPNNGQTPEQQARDRYDCYRFGLAQSGFDPLHPKGGVPTAQASEQEAAYDRVRTACLEGRGYTVR